MRIPLGQVVGKYSVITIHGFGRQGQTKMSTTVSCLVGSRESDKKSTTGMEIPQDLYCSADERSTYGSEFIFWLDHAEACSQKTRPSTSLPGLPGWTNRGMRQGERRLLGGEIVFLLQGGDGS